jgi:ectoine hydroxylase-related dioxygenase (phytanoyl-CoA dioxygenase family)
LASWLAGGPLGEVGRAALGCPEVVVLQAVLIAKPPAPWGAIPWHRDAWYMRYLDAAGVISVRLALDPETPASGGLQVLPGSHAWPDVLGDAVSADALPPDARARLPAPLRSVAPEPLLLAPGDLSVHRARTWHASPPNRGTSDRRTVVVHLFDARFRLHAAAMPGGPPPNGLPIVR